MGRLHAHVLICVCVWLCPLHVCHCVCLPSMYAMNVVCVFCGNVRL